MSKLLTTVALAAGIALLVWILSESDLDAAIEVAARVGVLGLTAILFVFAAGFAAEIAAWALTFGTSLRAQWLWRLWRVNMVGEALSVVMPFGALGGEPFKALLLNRAYGVPYPTSSSSLVLVQTMFAMAQVPFVLIGLGLALASGVIPTAIVNSMIIAALGLTVLMLFCLIAIHRRWLSALPRFLDRSSRFSSLSALIASLVEIEHHLFDFFRRNPSRFISTLTLFFINWLFGVAEIWVILQLVDAPVSFWDCWIIEAAIVLIKSATFFVPAHLGSLEAVTIYVSSIFTGSTEIGLGLAILRRLRELIWTVVGLVIGAFYSWLWPTSGQSARF
ncbi:uncharacterized membrane protein YbhN (UPF0104 family) [Rhodoligotrophos appendicifer]|uniref:lysylphosphatidylglycerol synthase domain-containing protein n=1 Tax=Rhodoligotrophos appendicifer TaxID=987056 RepID=UPI001184F0BA|nr:lysylphosphatidylglycerol synthase domain-containing protein [Rhodoligotrophos appendicifer]